MSALTDAGLRRRPRPLALPVDVDIDRLAFDQDPLDREFQRDVLESLKVVLHLLLHAIEDVHRKHQSLDGGQILLDVGLPQLDGLELTRRLRARTETATLPIVILTAHTGPPARELALAAGANLVLTKPCLPDEVARAIRKLLDSPTPRVPPQSAAG